MSTQRRFLFMLLAAALLLSWGGNQGMAVPRDGTAVETKQQAKKVTQKDRDKAAARALQKGALNPLMITAEPTAADVMPMAAAAALPGQAPRYFSHPNYANSPLPEVTTGAETVEGNALEDLSPTALMEPGMIGLMEPGEPGDFAFLDGVIFWSFVTLFFSRIVYRSGPVLASGNFCRRGSTGRRCA